MDPTKIAGISEWPIPKAVKEVRSFLGFGNFYRRFIRNYSNEARALNQTLQKSRTFEWTPETNQSFENLKKRFTEEPVLRMPDTTRPFQIECDTSKYALGAILTQIDDEGRRHPISFLSKSFDQHEQNYGIEERELLSIIRALREWRHLIIGGKYPTVILTDHRNIETWSKPRVLKGRLNRWYQELSEYNAEIKYMPGSKMVQADALSRRPTT